MIPITCNPEHKEKEMKRFTNKLKQINKKCGISQDECWPAYYYIAIKKDTIINYLDLITDMLEPNSFNTECCFSKDECDDISEILSKLRKRLLKINRTLEGGYKEIILFDNYMKNLKGK